MTGLGENFMINLTVWIQSQDNRLALEFLGALYAETGNAQDIKMVILIYFFRGVVVLMMSMCVQDSIL